MLTNLDTYCDGLAAEIADYRAGEIKIDRAHVRRWVDQFEPAEREFIAWQTTEIMKHWYATQANVAKMPALLAASTSFAAGKTAEQFWKEANILSLQSHGSSQAEILALFDGVLRASYGFGLAQCGAPSGAHVYVDDCLFSGQQVKKDLRRWIETTDARGKRILVVTIGCHRGGLWHVQSALDGLLGPRGNALDFYAAVTIEDRKSALARSEVLRPPLLTPPEAAIDEFAALLAAKGHPPAWRPVPATLPKGFASEENRTAYERVMLRKGIALRALCRTPDDHMKPLGYTGLWTFGFGALFTTYRNCANNAPLAWWWGDPNAEGPLGKWYPLLPRKRPNSVTEILRRLGLR